MKTLPALLCALLLTNLAAAAPEAIRAPIRMRPQHLAMSQRCDKLANSGVPRSALPHDHELADALASMFQKRSQQWIDIVCVDILVKAQDADMPAEPLFHALLARSAAVDAGV